MKAHDSRCGTLTPTKAISRDGQVKVEWEETGEGWQGDFDPDDPEDEELLRFYVYRKVGREWHPVEDGSYCTAMPVATSPAIRKRALVALMNELYDGARDGRVEPGRYEVDGASGFKRRAEEMSWLCPNDFKERRT
ncbi:MAG: hypothetical protein KGJ23_08045 [Euryarchaeota archaeon]|nr:hypothetical protein [Euryarchaeota archaeon]MDE1836552.1 hypothetical protein [Euryarchaeota archaeon]MDE1879253.1 hypothetical protein [Euryarchaeota archaeon]MDE2044522.1 hypothetical protein [Thermoplasmata archaeon]